MTGLGAVLVATLAWGALAFGAVYPWAYWPLAVVSSALGVWAIVATRAWQDVRIRPLMMAASAVALAIALQAIALPYSLLGRLSPAVDRFLREYQLVYHPASLHSLSLDPSATLVALALYVAMALLCIGLTRAVRAVGLEWLVVQVMAFGVALAVVGVVQKAFIVDPSEALLYGFWRPVRPGNPFGPFINRNHFAGWMVMALPLVVGYACGVVARLAPAPQGGWGGWLRWAASEEASRPLLLVACVLVMGMALTLTGSRSGVAAFVAAMGVMATFIGVRVKQRRVRLVATTGVLVLVVAAVAWAGAGATVARFELAAQDAGGRLSAWRDTTRIVSDFPLFGTGLGTFRLAMLIYQTDARHAIFAQAHNEYLQLAAEGGLLVLLPAAVLAWLVLTGISRRLTSGDDDPLTSWVRAGAVAGLVGIGTQSLVEFSLQMPGNRVLFVVLLAVALHRPARRRHHEAVLA